MNQLMMFLVDGDEIEQCSLAS